LNKPDIKSVWELLRMKLHIPNYQRPYKWTIKNVEALLSDMETAVQEAQKYSGEYKYRIGSVILHEKEGKYDIVDGQQRIITLLLIYRSLETVLCDDIFGERSVDKITVKNIRDNSRYIDERIESAGWKENGYKAALEDIFEAVIIIVDKLPEAFQMFDSQNSRGKALDPHDLLKAYHLREMQGDPHGMRHVVTDWEAHDMKAIHELFSKYLYPILCWSRRQKCRQFSAAEIDEYKGISLETGYTYARRAGNAMPFFQLTEPFIAGEDFFRMVEHYLCLREDIETEIKENHGYIIEILKDDGYKSVGFDHAVELFWCALMCYYDRFHNFDTRVVKKLFVWAFMLRVDMFSLGYDSINKYAVGEDGGKYSNCIDMFSRIINARTHRDIAAIQVSTERKNQRNQDNKWSDLYKKLIGVTTHDREG